MKTTKAILTALLCLSAFISLSAQPRDYVKKVYTSSIGGKLAYSILYPENFDPAQSYPLLVFLHGSGERGDDNVAQLKYGGRQFASDEILKQAIFLVPQCPVDDFWVLRTTVDGHSVMLEDSPIAPAMLAVKELIDHLTSLGFVDTDRVYCTGLSMGGMGTFDLALRYPDLFAAVAVICGSVNLDRVKAYKGPTVFRFYHGAKDTIVPPETNQEAYKILCDNGIEAYYKLYPDDDHGCWYDVFAEPDFISWFFSHKKGN